MLVFHCDQCQNLVYIENGRCYGCGSTLAFLPDRGIMSALAPLHDGVYAATATGSEPARYRRCQNDLQHGNCNWAVAEQDPNPHCASCRMTKLIPDLSIPGFADAWALLEQTKRRLLFNLMRMGLPLQDKLTNPADGLEFLFLADAGPGERPVLTGHLNGVITLNIAEANDEERERRRLNLREPYRTLLGHMRHESGHYYWDRLVRDSNQLPGFRALFGDERQDYAAALDRHYRDGPPADWVQSHVSSYASSHPLEDWAETWAHYLHIFHTLETAGQCGLILAPVRDDEPHVRSEAILQGLAGQDIHGLITPWLSITYLLNNLNRSLGQRDAYPFVLTAKAIEKLEFVQAVIGATRSG